MAAAAFAFCAWKVFSLDSRSPTNRLAVLFNVVFAIWATAASFWYATPYRETADWLYRAFSWTWCVFPPIMLHFTLMVTDSPPLKGGKRALFVSLMYLPSLALAVATPLSVLTEPEYRGGYWMLAIRHNAAYYLFVTHYFSYILASVIIAFRRRKRSDNRRTRIRLLVLGSSYLAAGILGFVTDSIFLFLGIDFPNMAIIWIVILSVGMIVAMDRYGLLSALPSHEALAILESMPGYVVYFDDAGRLVWANASAVEAIGARNLSDARSMTSGGILAGGLADLATVADGQSADSMEYRTSLGPGAIPVSVRIHPVRGDGNEGLVMTATDLRPERARARAERRLAEVGLLMDEFMSRSLDGIVLTDTEGRVVRWNEPMASMTGIAAKDAVGALYWDLRASLEPADRRAPERVRAAIRAVLDGKEAPWTRRIIESEIVRADGATRLVQSDSFTIPHADGTILAIIARDVTEERRLAEENIERIRNLDHAQKMEAVGTLSGGIAHDFNNTLSGIIGAVSLIRQGSASGACLTVGDIGRELDIIERSANRAASSVKRLLTLTRKRSPERARFRLDEAIRRVAEFAERSVDQSVKIRMPTEPPAAIVSGDAGQMEQLALNLVINAEHAMTLMRPAGQRRGGSIDLSIEGFRPDAAFLSANPGSEERDYWVLRIRDEGVGIPRHIMNRIFDPFYTTKKHDSSSGLGLAMVHAIARQHDGFVSVRSEPGSGAEFSVYLPAVSGEVDTGAAESPSSGGGRLVLIADDDDIPRETALAILKALGYRAVAACSGVEARDLFSERPGEWAAAILDMRMGELGGAELAAGMRGARPDMPIILASGYHDENAERDGLECSGCVVIDKPYTIAELGAALDRALRQAGPA